MLVGSSDTVDRLFQKGLTASGNVADSHCVPVLAPFSFDLRPGEPIAGAKLQLLNETNKEKSQNKKGKIPIISRVAKTYEKIANIPSLWHYVMDLFFILALRLFVFVFSSYLCIGVNKNAICAVKHIMCAVKHMKWIWLINFHWFI